MENLLEYLNSKSINYQLEQHEEVFTVEAMMAQKVLQDAPGMVVKNLFVKDKKKKDLWLITTRHDLNFKLSQLAKKLSVKDFRMAEEAKMIELLGVAQGCATPMALLNDKEKKVKLILDSELIENDQTLVWSHPLVNDHSIGLSAAEFNTFLNSLDRSDDIIKVDFSTLT